MFLDPGACPGPRMGACPGLDRGSGAGSDPGFTAVMASHFPLREALSCSNASRAKSLAAEVKN
ncbi:MAG: hypothetical protein AB1512_20135, partial [Thermodesulfobacteriota bacterium]